MINRLYSLLTRGTGHAADYYQRAVTSSEISDLTSRADILQILAPAGLDASYANYRAEQLTQLCRKSRLRAELARLDPLNTYNYEFTGVPENLLTVTGLPATLAFDLLEPPEDHQWIARRFAISVTPGQNIAAVDGVEQSLGWSLGISLPLTLDGGLALVLRGVIPLAPFTFYADLVRRPHLDILTLEQQVSRIDGVQWHDPYTEYNSVLEPESRLSAFILNYLEYDAS